MFACVIYLTLSIATSSLGVTIDFLHSNTSGRLIYVFSVNAVIVSLSFVFIRLARHSVDGVMNMQAVLVSTAMIVSNLIVLLLLLKYASITPNGLISPVTGSSLLADWIVPFFQKLWPFHNTR